MLRRPLAAALSTLSLAALAVPAAAQQFESGDLYVMSSSIAIGGISKNGIVRVDPYTGAKTLVKVYQQIGSANAFDPYRGALVSFCTPPAPQPFGLYAIDSLGNATFLNTDSSNARCIASAGDGRLYYVATDGSVRWIDAANGKHDLLNLAGNATYKVTSLGSPASTIYYDAPTNSLLFGILGSTTPCATNFNKVTYVLKVALNPAGTQVASTDALQPICIGGTAGTFGDVYSPNSFQPGPGGLVYLSVDDNSNETLSRMLVIDPATLGYSVFATNGAAGSYLPAATNAGCFSHALNRGVILDTGGDSLRLYTQGESGAGTVLASGDLISSGGGSAEITSVVEVPFGIFGGLANYGTGTPGCAGAQIMGANSAPVANAPNFRLTTTSAPASSLGLCLVTDAADPLGSDPFFIGILLHVDLFNSTQAIPIDMNSNGFGFGLTATSIPLAPFLVGSTFYAQSIWAWTGCSTPSQFGLSSSNGLAVTIQP
jgi:hypothetical protein